MKKCKSAKRQFLSVCAVPALAVFALAGALTGCVSNKSSSAITAAPSNLYFGSGDAVWGITLDPATEYFSYTNINASGAQPGFVPLNGAFTTASSGFLDLTLTQASASVSVGQGGTGAGGYAVLFPDEGMLMRTGSSTIGVSGGSSLLIGAVPSAACPALSSPETFNFISMGTPITGDKVVHAAYGAIQISQGNADSWSFSNFTMDDIGGNALSPVPIADATCPATQEGFVLVSPIAQTTPFPPPYTPTQTTTGISPSGLLVINQGEGSDTTPTGPSSLLGVIKPSAALNVSDMVGKSYAGFESDPLSPLGTIAVVFGAGSGTAITGGGFPKDDVTQSPVIDTTLDLGTLSAQTPGLFPSVTLTRPDTFEVCVGTPSGGTDSNGNPTCIFHGVAVAGQVNGKYVIFTNINNPTALTSKGATPLAVINLALYQQ